MVKSVICTETKHVHEAVIDTVECMTIVSR